jgi:P27 family predicted phage terminase small subunit
MRRLPTNLKLLKGTYQPCRGNTNEPQPEAARPPCPSFLSQEGKKEWRRVSKELFVLGLLSNLDRAALAAYCQAYGRWIEAERALTREGLMVMSPNGFQQPNPWLSIASKALDQLRAFAADFGMSPVARSKVTVTATLPTKPNRLSKYLNTPKSPWDELVGEAEKEARFFGEETAI